MTFASSMRVITSPFCRPAAWAPMPSTTLPISIPFFTGTPRRSAASAVRESGKIPSIGRRVKRRSWPVSSTDLRFSRPRSHPLRMAAAASAHLRPSPTRL